MKSRSSLTPEQARAMIARLMSDGRERTAADVGARLGITSHKAGRALTRLAEMGVVHKERIWHGDGDTIIYRAIRQEAAE